MKRILVVTALSLTLLTLLTSFAGFAALASGPQPATPRPAGAFPFRLEPAIETFEGTAAEVVDVSGYTYTLVDTGSERRWVVSLHKPVVEGAHVAVRSFGTQRDFTSPKLHRVFAKLWFAVVRVQ